MEIEQGGVAPALRSGNGGASNGAVVFTSQVASAISASAGHHGHSSPRGDGSDNLVYAIEDPGGKMSGGPEVGLGVNESVMYTLPADPSHQHAVFAIQDGREIEKHQNGLGISVDSVAYTIDGTGAQSVGYVPDMVARAMSSKWAKGSSGPAGDEVQNMVAPRGVVRRLTPKESERLQGFPDDWTGGGQADSHRYRQIGNAVAVPVANWIARRIQDNA